MPLPWQPPAADAKIFISDPVGLAAVGQQVSVPYPTQSGQQLGFARVSNNTPFNLAVTQGGTPAGTLPAYSTDTYSVSSTGQPLIFTAQTLNGGVPSQVVPTISVVWSDQQFPGTFPTQSQYVNAVTTTSDILFEDVTIPGGGVYDDDVLITLPPIYHTVMVIAQPVGTTLGFLSVQLVDVNTGIILSSVNQKIPPGEDTQVPVPLPALGTTTTLVALVINNLTSNPLKVSAWVDQLEIGGTVNIANNAFEPNEASNTLGIVYGGSTWPQTATLATTFLTFTGLNVTWAVVVSSATPASGGITLQVQDAGGNNTRFFERFCVGTTNDDREITLPYGATSVGNVLFIADLMPGTSAATATIYARATVLA